MVFVCDRAKRDGAYDWANWKNRKKAVGLPSFKKACKKACGSDGKWTLLINRSVVTSPSSLRTSTSAQIAQTAERQLCSRRGLTGDADAAARTAPVGRDGMCTPASRLGPQGGSGRGEQAKVTFGPVLSYPETAMSTLFYNPEYSHAAASPDSIGMGCKFSGRFALGWLARARCR